jgi:hypothetical protein
MWHNNKRLTREGLLHEYGVAHGSRKIEDFLALGPAPWSVLAMHNTVLAEVRSAFAAGAYYPALLGAAGLGERLLNQLMLELRDDFGDHPHTRRVAEKDSVDSWTTLIEVLREWGVLRAEVSRKYKQLHRLRTESVHYLRPSLSESSREEALQAVTLLQQIIEELFSPHSGDHFIRGTSGAFYLKLDAEKRPFVKRFLIPASALLSPEHELDLMSIPQRVFDNLDYGRAEGLDALSDEEFAARVG